ncbi:hypothetical protein J437_LFUL015254 [Ladona fulva]|uniref:Uncharacterized protein n=1 Tax=Ladona fulva TaxID=123851 RepID=A0A8K0K7Y2_LADFU|nr:hypothetical protein J437_LFUL015254 [Ladona fulva]
MGRLRRERKKFHLKAVAPKTENEPGGVIVSKSEIYPPLPLPSIPDSIFSGINISLDNLEIPAEDSDKRSVCKSAGYEECGNRISKKSKMKLRRENFLKKLELFYQDIKEKRRKLTEKKQNKVITWDMKPLVSALPTSEELDEIREKKIKPKMRKKRSTQKAQVRQKDWLANIEVFKSTLQNSTVKSNPLEMITSIVIKNFETKHHT